MAKPIQYCKFKKKKIEVRSGKKKKETVQKTGILAQKMKSGYRSQ